MKHDEQLDQKGKIQMKHDEQLDQKTNIFFCVFML